MDIPAKLLTPDEATALLSRIIPLVEQLQGLQVSIHRITQELEGASERLTVEETQPASEIRQQVVALTEHQRGLIEAFDAALEQLSGYGCILKDLDQGLADFYAIHHDDLVFLCWRLGEDRVRFWHAVEAGFAGRQPL